MIIKKECGFKRLNVEKDARQLCKKSKVEKEVYSYNDYTCIHACLSKGSMGK